MATEVLKEASARRQEAKEDELQGSFTTILLLLHYITYVYK